MSTIHQFQLQHSLLPPSLEHAPYCRLETAFNLNAFSRDFVTKSSTHYVFLQHLW